MSETLWQRFGWEIVEFLSYTATITGKKMGGERKAEPAQELALGILFGRLPQSVERNNRVLCT